jgi:hypothetical protein
MNLEDALPAGTRQDSAAMAVALHAGVLTDLGPMKSTQFALEQALAMHKRTPLSRHLEIETYTWDVPRSPRPGTSSSTSAASSSG